MSKQVLKDFEDDWKKTLKSFILNNQKIINDLKEKRKKMKREISVRKKYIKKLKEEFKDDNSTLKVGTGTTTIGLNKEKENERTN